MKFEEWWRNIGQNIKINGSSPVTLKYHVAKAAWVTAKVEGVQLCLELFREVKPSESVEDIEDLLE